MSPSLNLLRLVVALLLSLGMAAVATAANRTWIGGNADWTTSNALWNPADEPDFDDVAIFNTPNSVDLANVSEQLAGLTMSNGISLSTNGNGLFVNGTISLSGASTDLFVEGASSILLADVITINSDAGVTLRDGATMWMLDQTGVALLDVNNGGDLAAGNGLILFDGPLAAGDQVFNLDGTLSVGLTSGLNLSNLTAETLTITVSDPDGLIDLDGNDGISTINVNRNDALFLNGGVLDSAYSGMMNLGSGAMFSRDVAWSLDGTINTVLGGLGGSFSAAATIAGAAFTQTGGTIAVDAGETLRISSMFHADDGVIANNGLIIFGNAATIDNASQFQTGTQGSIEVNAEVDVFDQGWDWDGDGGSNNVITIGDAGRLSITFPADDTWDGLMNINGGVLFVTAADDTWGQGGGTINVNGPSFSSLSGDDFVMTGGTFNVTGQGNVFFNADNTWTGGTLNIDGLVLFQSDVTFNGSTITGNGTLETSVISQVTSNTTIDVRTFEWDGDFLSLNNVHTIHNSVVFTINSLNFDADDDDMDDAVNLGGNGAQLIVNSANPASWTMNDTLTANTAAAGMATIGGTRRFVLAGTLHVTGNTTISAPVTFDGGSTTTIDAGFTLTNAVDAVYDGGLITGPGTFTPGDTIVTPNALAANLVSSNTTISTHTFDFGAGRWRIEPGATLTVNVSDYSLEATNVFGTSITINSGTVNVNTADAQFVSDSIIRLNNITGAPAIWSGEPLVIGNGLTLDQYDAQVLVDGPGISRINSVVTFVRDSFLHVDAGATLVLGNSATFAAFDNLNNRVRGEGTLVTNNSVGFLERTVMNMDGGTVDFDGENSDTTGNIITIDGPLIINAAMFESFGVLKMPGPGDRIDVNSVVGTGSLAINLDDPNAEWTVDAAGMLRVFNDNTNEVLLSGSDVNILGALTAGGEVQTNARLDIGAGGLLNLNTAGEPFHLNGGNNTDDPNTIAGGSIFGPGILAASDGHALVGFGALNANVDFDGAAHLLVKDGTLYVSSTIVDVGTLGTVNSTGTLYMLNPWNTNVADLVQLNGGEITAGAITNDGAAGINGFGLISARVINNTRIDAENGPLLIVTFTNDNDWDGAGGTGALNAISGDLEIRDNESFPFTGTVTAGAGRTVFASGFELEFQPGSTLSLADGARYRSTNGTHLGGAVMVTGGTASLEIGATTVFESGGTVVLAGDLRLENPVTVVEAGVSFSGGGTLNNLAGRTLRLLDGANVSVQIENQGTLALGASAGQVQGLDFQQDASGALEIELAGISLNSFDRLALTGQALLDGTLNVSLLDAFNPALGNSFTFLSAAGGITGAFDTINLPNLAAGLTWSINDTPTFIQLIVTQAPLLGDYNSDGAVDAADYVLWRKNDGTQAGYDTWRAHFGQTAGNGTGAGANSGVPEPATLVTLILAAAGWCLRRADEQ